MEDGETCICSMVDLYNAFGDKQTMLKLGQKVTVIDSKYVGGMKFYAFKEAPKDNYFDGFAFKPMRTLN